MGKFLVAIDQGTTSSRAIVFDRTLKIAAAEQFEFPQYYPRSGWVEHEAEDIWRTSLSALQGAVRKARVKPQDIAAIGIANQRETTLVWDAKTGEPIHRAIVWQDRRTAHACLKLKKDGHEKTILRKTGLLLDPYFSASKIKWILDNVGGARIRAEKGELLFGTVDSFLLWRLTGGKVHATDATNASRTMLFDIHKGAWSKKLCALFDIPMAMLPRVADCAADFGHLAPDILGAPVPITGVAGDQQAAAIGQACFRPGMLKSTYGTGCFALMNTGDEAVLSKNRLLTTIAYQLGGERTYALEGSIFMAGATVQWLRDGLGLFRKASDVNALAMEADPEQHVYLVPAFVGLGAPHWDTEARGALYGLSRGTTKAEIARAALESVAYQTRDLIDAMHRDWRADSETVLRVDGGMSASDLTMQFLSDILGAPVDRPKIMETAALGAAYLAGLQVGILPKPEAFAKQWALDRHFSPQMSHRVRKAKVEGWREAVRRTLTV